MKYLGAPQSGSQANTTASHNRAGQYYRNRRTPVIPTRTILQSQLRARFGAASSAWQALSAIDQNSWTAFAAAYPVTDSLGQSITLTGHQYFVGVSTSLLNAGQVIITTVPANTTVVPMSGLALYADDIGAVVASCNSPTGGDFILQALSSVLSGGVSFNKTFSQMNVVQAGELGADLSSVYQSFYGVGTVGRKIFLRSTAVNSSGLSGPGTIQPAIIVSNASLSAITATSAAASTATATWAGGASYALFVFKRVAGTVPQPLLKMTGVTASPTVVTPLNTGDTVYFRAFDGVNMGLPSNDIIVT